MLAEFSFMTSIQQKSKKRECHPDSSKRGTWLPESGNRFPKWETRLLEKTISEALTNSK